VANHQKPSFLAEKQKGIVIFEWLSHSIVWFNHSIIAIPAGSKEGCKIFRQKDTKTRTHWTFNGKYPVRFLLNFWV
jgi:hypothetical protein